MAPIEFKNADYGIKATVNMVECGFSVSLIDTDADCVVQTFKIFPAIDPAIDYAKELVK